MLKSLLQNVTSFGISDIGSLVHSLTSLNFSYFKWCMRYSSVSIFSVGVCQYSVVGHLLIISSFSFLDFNHFPSITTYVKYSNSRPNRLLSICNWMPSSHLQPHVFKPLSPRLFLLKLLFFQLRLISWLWLFSFVLYLKLAKIPKFQFLHL